MTETLTVDGMACAGCEDAVEEALRGVDGVTDATADRETATASVEGDADPRSLLEAVEDAGYEASA